MLILHSSKSEAKLYYDTHLIVCTYADDARVTWKEGGGGGGGHTSTTTKKHLKNIGGVPVMYLVFPRMPGESYHIRDSFFVVMSA